MGRGPFVVAGFVLCRGEEAHGLDERDGEEDHARHEGRRPSRGSRPVGRAVLDRLDELALRVAANGRGPPRDETAEVAALRGSGRRSATRRSSASTSRQRRPLAQRVHLAQSLADSVRRPGADPPWPQRAAAARRADARRRAQRVAGREQHPELLAHDSGARGRCPALPPRGRVRRALLDHEEREQRTRRLTGWRSVLGALPDTNIAAWTRRQRRRRSSRPGGCGSPARSVGSGYALDSHAQGLTHAEDAGQTLTEAAGQRTHDVAERDDGEHASGALVAQATRCVGPNSFGERRPVRNQRSDESNVANPAHRASPPTSSHLVTTRTPARRPEGGGSARRPEPARGHHRQAEHATASCPDGVW